MSNQETNRSSGQSNCTNSTSVLVPEKIVEELKALQKKSHRVNQLYLKSRQALHKHLIESYLWWREAREIPGFIDAEYSKLNLRKSSGQMTPNFIPVLRVICGPNSNLDDRDFQRRSRALNALHLEYEADYGKYAKDTAPKLESFIISKGGLIELAESVKPERDSEEARSKAASRKVKTAKKREEADELLNSAKEAIANVDDMASYSGDDIADYVSTSEEQLFAVLMKITDKGRKIISKSDDPAIIESLLLNSYRSRFDLNKTAIRPLLELLQTQCLPQHLGKLSKRLMDSSTAKGLSKELRKSARRVMYLHETQQFLLSPVRAESGVVSLVKPKETLLGRCEQDVFMPLYLSRSLETKLLQSFDFNLYSSGEFREYPNTNISAHPSHTLSLVHFADDSCRIPIHFWPFYDSFPQPMDQLILASDYRANASWIQTQPHDWFQKLADDFLDPWLNGRGIHICRDEESIVEIVFEATKIEVKFFAPHSELDGDTADEFHGLETIELANGAMCAEPMTLRFLSKDWVVTMRSIARLPVDSAVSFGANNDGCWLEFETVDPMGVEHKIFIPSVDDLGTRSTTPFERHAPEPVRDADVDFFEDINGREHFEVEIAEREGVQQ